MAANKHPNSTIFDGQLHVCSTLGHSTKEFIKEMQAQYQYNQTQKEQIDTQRRTIMCAHEGFTAISRRFAEEADSRDWCEEANEFIINVNQDIPSPFSLEELYHDYNIDVTIRPDILVTLSTSVRARTYGEAEDLMRDDISMYFDDSDIREAIGDADISCYDIQDIEVSDA